jgi:hypothetical protein
MRPSVAFAAVKLLEDAGCTVEVPAAQTCCGQPALNSGDSVDARQIAMKVIAAFEGFDHLFGDTLGVGAVAAVQRRLAAAGLALGHSHLATGVFEQLHGGKGHAGPHQVGQAGHKKPHPQGRALVHVVSLTVLHWRRLRH